MKKTPILILIIAFTSSLGILFADYGDYSYIKYEPEICEVIGGATKTLGGFSDLPLIVTTGFIVKTSRGLQFVEDERIGDTQPEYLELLWNPDSCSYQVSTTKIEIDKF